MSIRIITTNIRFDNPLDGEHNWNGRRLLLSKILLDYFPDIIGTQEGRMPQLNDLNRLIGQYQLIDHHRQWINDRMYPCLFINPLTIEVMSSGDIWLSETPHVPGSVSFNSPFPRLCTWIKGRFKGSGQSFFLANVHLDHSQTYTRMEQLKVMLKEIAPINSLNHPVIFMGDFNEGPDLDVYQYLLKSVPTLYDPWKMLNKTEQSSHHNFGDEVNYADRIDWILLDKTFICEEVFFDKKSENKIFPSDHYPLKCQFSFNPS
jgi:endonuclease/exonuclease/phosphatase family metal-dependent hydrolase